MAGLSVVSTVLTAFLILGTVTEVEAQRYFITEKDPGTVYIHPGQDIEVVCSMNMPEADAGSVVLEWKYHFGGDFSSSIMIAPDKSSTTKYFKPDDEIELKSVLKIEDPVPGEDGGYYFCVFAFDDQEVKMSEAFIVVHYLEELPNVIFDEAVLTLTCSFEGSCEKDPEMLWYVVANGGASYLLIESGSPIFKVSDPKVSRPDGENKVLVSSTLGKTKKLPINMQIACRVLANEDSTETMTLITTKAPCPGGKFWLAEEFDCSPCAENTYSAGGAAPVCTPCPEGLTVEAGKGSDESNCAAKPEKKIEEKEGKEGEKEGKEGEKEAVPVDCYNYDQYNSGYRVQAAVFSLLVALSFSL